MAAPGPAGRRVDATSLPFRKNTDRENDPSAEKWSKVNVGSKKHSVALDKVKHYSDKIGKKRDCKHWMIIKPNYLSRR